MSKQDVKLVLSSADGKSVYINAMISRTLARQIEMMLENSGVVMAAAYQESKKENLHERV